MVAEKYLNDCDGVLVAGGFGERGIEGKILAIQYARENKIPFLRYLSWDATLYGRICKKCS